MTRRWTIDESRSIIVDRLIDNLDLGDEELEDEELALEDEDAANHAPPGVSPPPRALRAHTPPTSPFAGGACAG